MSVVSTILARGLQPASVLAQRRPHGDRLRYHGGCRCDACRAANSRYEVERRKARKNGDWNGLVPADAARRHIRQLSRRGVGRRSIAAVSDVALTLIQDIRSGRRQQIRARTERRILAVTPAQIADGATVPAARTWSLIGELLAEGYTRTFIAAQLGSKARKPALQLRKDFVQVRTAYQVERLHRRLTS